MLYWQAGVYWLQRVPHKTHVDHSSTNIGKLTMSPARCFFALLLTAAGQKYESRTKPITACV